jgi:hypothetical protein
MIGGGNNFEVISYNPIFIGLTDIVPEFICETWMLARFYILAKCLTTVKGFQKMSK